jgi:PHP family Zn ribbon phosphoesterase
MLKEYKADLHIHTCLSPCADLHMNPVEIIRTATETGLDIIAITDHNSSENVISTVNAAANSGLTVLAGMEVTTSEEVHIVALFNDITSLTEFQGIVYKNLQPGENDESKFGEQVVVNENNEVLCFNKRLLIGATVLNASSIVSIIHRLGGISIASHIDREAFGIISQLGFIPNDLKFDALEISPKTDREKAGQLFKDYRSYTWISSSDAHYLKDIGKRKTHFFMNEPTISEISRALHGTGGRKAVW